MQWIKHIYCSNESIFHEFNVIDVYALVYSNFLKNIQRPQMFADGLLDTRAFRYILLMQKLKKKKKTKHN